MTLPPPPDRWTIELANTERVRTVTPHPAGPGKALARERANHAAVVMADIQASGHRRFGDHPARLVSVMIQSRVFARRTSP